MRRKVTKAITAALAAAFLGAIAISAQPNLSAPFLEKPVSAEIRGGEKHQYQVRIEPNRYVFFKLTQHGIDLGITTIDPKGNKIADFDSPNGSNGPEYFSITSGLKGIYSLEVKALSDDAGQGKYDLRIGKIVPKAVSAADQVDQLFTQWDNPDAPGAAVSVVKDGKIIFKKGYGISNLEYDIPIKPTTIFHIASVSKQFTAFAVLLLEADGKVSIDDDVRKYIPEVPDFGKTITLRHLATHTSGLRDQWNLLGLAGWRIDDVITREHILKLVSRQKELNFNPGEEYLYCNTGFTLLAEVVARVSGKSFAVFTDERIFKPLKMNHTLFYDDHEKIVRNRAYSYYGTGGGFKKSKLNYSNVGATSLFTTVEDLAIWAMNFERPVVGNPAIMAKMNTPGKLNNGTDLNYALGQTVGKYKGLPTIGHGGGDAGFRTYLIRFPEQKASIVVFSNDAAFNPNAIAYRVADIYLKDEIAAAEKPGNPVKTAARAASPDGTSSKYIAVDPAILERYTGRYEIQPGFEVTISREGETLYGQPTGQAKMELKAKSNSVFVEETAGIEVSFEETVAKSAAMTINQRGRLTKALRVKPFDPEDLDLNEYTGTFYSDELSTEYVLAVETKTLVAHHARHSDIKFSPLKKDIFRGGAWFFRDMEFVRDSANKILGIRVSSGRVRNAWFRKTGELP